MATRKSWAAKPVRAIIKAASKLGGATAVRNALGVCGYNVHTTRHISSVRLLGSLPRPALEAVLQRLSR